MNHLVLVRTVQSRLSGLVVVKDMTYPTLQPLFLSRKVANILLFPFLKFKRAPFFSSFSQFSLSFLCFNGIIALLDVFSCENK